VEKIMSISRRQLIKMSGVSAIGVPMMFTPGAEAFAGPGESSIDFSMGFPHDAVLLNRNENPIGPSSQAIEAAQAGVTKSFRYADPILLRSLIAKHHDIDEAWVLVGTGSGELLKLQAVAFARDGNVVSTRQTYKPPPTYAAKLGAEIKWIDHRIDQGFSPDIDGMLAAVDSNTRVFYLVSPNNPTGKSISYDTLRRVVDSMPKDVLLVMDEAYVDFQPEGRNGLDLLKAGYENVLVTRTFSKAHALAGLRIGYGLGHPKIMKEIAKYGCGPTSTNMAGFGAAVASLGDEAHLERSRAFVSQMRAHYQKETQKLGLASVSGNTPFTLIELGENAGTIKQELAKRHVFVRHGKEWGFPDHIRVTYGLEEENRAFFATLGEIMGHIKSA
jgi:histidinol-phosphate aminotransferase